MSQPSAALVAQADAQSAFDDLFLGLGAVALLVGAVGVANIMVISVLERRSEIGLRRALGATKGHIRIQFLSEAVPLALLGGAVGVGLGVLSTAIYATTKGWTVVVPVLAWGGGFGAALLIGAVAGLLPAPTRHLISLLAGRWTLAVLAQLADGGRRYQDSMTHSKVSRTSAHRKPPASRTRRTDLLPPRPRPHRNCHPLSAH